MPSQEIKVVYPTTVKFSALNGASVVPLHEFSRPSSWHCF